MSYIQYHLMHGYERTWNVLTCSMLVNGCIYVIIKRASRGRRGVNKLFIPSSSKVTCGKYNKIIILSKHWFFKLKSPFTTKSHMLFSLTMHDAHMLFHLLQCKSKYTAVFLLLVNSKPLLSLIVIQLTQRLTEIISPLLSLYPIRTIMKINTHLSWCLRSGR